MVRLYNTVNMYKKLNSNVKRIIMFEPLWAIPFQMMAYYASLYMYELGITERQIGYITSIFICLFQYGYYVY